MAIQFECNSSKFERVTSFATVSLCIRQKAIFSKIELLKYFTLREEIIAHLMFRISISVSASSVAGYLAWWLIDSYIAAAISFLTVQFGIATYDLMQASKISSNQSKLNLKFESALPKIIEKQKKFVIAPCLKVKNSESFPIFLDFSEFLWFVNNELAVFD